MKWSSSFLLAVSLFLPQLVSGSGLSDTSSYLNLGFTSKVISANSSTVTVELDLRLANTTSSAVSNVTVAIASPLNMGEFFSQVALGDLMVDGEINADQVSFDFPETLSAYFNKKSRYFFLLEYFDPLGKKHSHMFWRAPDLI